MGKFEFRVKRNQVLEEKEEAKQSKAEKANSEEGRGKILFCQIVTDCDTISVKKKLTGNRSK